MTITGGNLVDDFNFVFFQMSLVENKYHGQHGGSSFELPAQPTLVGVDAMQFGCIAMWKVW